MSKENDYLKLIEPLWNIEQFDTWDTQLHCTVAYAIDKLYDTKEYPEIFDRWISWLEQEEYIEFSFDIVSRTIDAALCDDKLPPEEKAWYKHAKDLFEDIYKDKDNAVTSFGVVDVRYAPKWFYGLFQSHFTLKKIECEEAIIRYCETEEKMSHEEATKACQYLKRYTMFLTEFYFYVENKRFKQFWPLKICDSKTGYAAGYSAQMLHEKYGMSPLEAYKFLIYMNENREPALAELRKIEETLQEKDNNT